MQVSLKAHAKINLGLRLGPVRPDGYHELSSFFQEISLADDLFLRTTEDSSVTLTCDHPDLPADETNLCLKATQLLRQATGYKGGVHIELHKRIPIGAGLGGGSSNAAAVLKGLNELWELRLDQKTLLSLAAQLGSDVPYFIYGGCCLAAGRGELLQKVEPFLNEPLILVLPNVSISTAWAYKILDNYRLTSALKNITFQRFSEKDLQNPTGLRILNNDFEPPIFAHHPDLQTLHGELIRCGAHYASLSGSGAALYGVFRSWAQAQQAAAHLQRLGTVRVEPINTVD